MISSARFYKFFERIFAISYLLGKICLSPFFFSVDSLSSSSFGSIDILCTHFSYFVASSVNANIRIDRIYVVQKYNILVIYYYN